MQNSTVSKKWIFIAVGLVIFIGAIVSVSLLLGGANNIDESDNSEVTEQPLTYSSNLGYSIASNTTLDITTTGGPAPTDTIQLPEDTGTEWSLTLSYVPTNESVANAPEGYPGISIPNRQYSIETINGLSTVRITDNPDTREDFWIYTDDKALVIHAAIKAKDKTHTDQYLDILKTFKWTV